MSSLPSKTLALLDDPDALLAELVPGSIGYVGLDISEDVLAATQKPTAHLPWRPDAKTPFADQWLETSFPVYARSILEDWSKGAYDHLSAVVFSRGEDVAQRLWYYTCELQRRGKLAGPKAVIFDVPRIQRSTSAAYSADSIRRICRDLDIDEAALRAGAVLANSRRDILTSAAGVADADGVDANRFARASLLPAFEALSGTFPSEVKRETKRVLLAGSTPPDGRLHSAIAAAGGNVVDTLNDVSLARLGGRIDCGASDIFEAVGSASNAADIGPRTFFDAPDTIVTRARTVGVDAVIFWAIEEDEARAWHVPRVKARLETAGIPHLMLTRKSWTLADSTSDDIFAFLEMLP